MYEPYRIKVVESLPRVSPSVRRQAMATAGYNTFFETTRANIEALGCEARDLPDTSPPWCGNIDLARLDRTLRRNRRVRLVVLTVTNNIEGGQPVSIENITREHLEHVGEVVGRVYRLEPMKLRCVHRPEEFSSFFARFVLR